MDMQHSLDMQKLKFGSKKNALTLVKKKTRQLRIHSQRLTIHFRATEKTKPMHGDITIIKNSRPYLPNL